MIKWEIMQTYTEVLIWKTLFIKTVWGKKGGNNMKRAEVLEYLIQNPTWISGFAAGEGSFTASYMVYTKGRWGLQPQCEFNITQKNHDKELLIAINESFGNCGGVYDKPNNMCVVAFRRISILKGVIIPFFQRYPLIGVKGLEFTRWCKLVEILDQKQYIGRTLLNRDILIEWGKISKHLNSSRLNNSKQARIDKKIDWLSE